MPALTTLRARILVKAYPQPSKKLEETVCVAAVSEDGKRMLRLYPIRFRRLLPEQRFDRFDLIECNGYQPSSDGRPESYHIDESSIRLVDKTKSLNNFARIRLWQDHIVASLTALEDAQRLTKQSLGIVKPDIGSVKFIVVPIAEANADDRELAGQLMQQQSLLETPLIPLEKSEFAFKYSFTSGGKSHEHTILDWEVQAAWFSFQRRYGSKEKALDMLKQEYGERIPAQNLHIIFGNQHARPWQFIIIGLLRTPLNPEEVNKQGQLF